MTKPQDATHKYPINERIRIELPNLGLVDSPGVVHTRHEVEVEGAIPMYDVVARKTNGVYRVSEDMIRTDPDYATTNTGSVQLDKAARVLAAAFLEKDASACTLDDYNEEDGEYVRERIRKLARAVRNGEAG